MKETEFKFSPIGYLKCSEKYRAEQPRQGVFTENTGVIKLNKSCNFEQALKDLKGVDRIWVIFIFHHNKKWKPLVQPPMNKSGKKVGVFATRSPHRPNNIGISCVKLLNVDTKKLSITIANFDLLNETPILDIKPYIPIADSFPTSKVKWLEEANNDKKYKTSFSNNFIHKATFIFKISKLDIKNYCEVQLSSDPLNNKRKRISQVSNKDNYYYLGCRTWKILFHIDTNNQIIYVEDIFSNYKSAELTAAAIQKEDKYGEKKFHVEFQKKFND